MEIVAQNSAIPETTALVITHAMRMGTKCVCLVGEELTVIKLSVKLVVTQSTQPVIILENACATRAGEENYVISVSYILAVFMGPAVNHGSAIVSHSGEDYFVMKISTHADYCLAKMEVYATTQ